MFSWFINIGNCLKSMGKTYCNRDLITKILRSLPKFWEQKVTTIEEVNDLKNFAP